MAVGKSYKIDFENNADKFRGEWGNRKKNIAYAIGLKWQEICTKVITKKGIVDTGRLRGSLTFITENKVGSSISRVSTNENKDFLTGSAGEGEVIMGSNVVYAAKQEFTNKKGSFLKDSIVNYREDYENIAQAIMEK